MEIPVILTPLLNLVKERENMTKFQLNLELQIYNFFLKLSPFN